MVTSTQLTTLPRRGERQLPAHLLLPPNAKLCLIQTGEHVKDFAIADESGHVTQGLGHMAAVTAAFVSGDRLVSQW